MFSNNSFNACLNVAYRSKCFWDTVVLPVSVMESKFLLVLNRIFRSQDDTASLINLALIQIALCKYRNVLPSVILFSKVTVLVTFWHSPNFWPLGKSINRDIIYDFFLATIILHLPDIKVEHNNNYINNIKFLYIKLLFY